MAISFEIDTSNYVPLKLKPTNDVIWDNDNGIVFRKFKGYMIVDTDNMPQIPIIKLDINQFRPYGFCTKFFISNIKATKMTMDETSYNGEVNRFEPSPSDTVGIYCRNNLDLYLEIDTAVLAACTVYIEADFWFGWSTTVYAVDDLVGSVINKTIYDKSRDESYFALEPLRIRKSKYIMPGDDGSLISTLNDIIIDNNEMLRDLVPPTKTSITITSYNGSKTYDGTSLTNHNYTTNYNGSDPEVLADLDAIDISFSGSQTNVGSSSNYFDIDWNGVNEDKYDITKEYGTLTVNSPGGSDAPSAPM